MIYWAAWTKKNHVTGFFLNEWIQKLYFKKLEHHLYYLASLTLILCCVAVNINLSRILVWKQNLCIFIYSVQVTWGHCFELWFLLMMCQSYRCLNTNIYVFRSHSNLWSFIYKFMNCCCHKVKCMKEIHEKLLYL